MCWQRRMRRFRFWPRPLLLLPFIPKATVLSAVPLPVICIRSEEVLRCFQLFFPQHVPLAAATAAMAGSACCFFCS